MEIVIARITTNGLGHFALLNSGALQAGRGLAHLSMCQRTFGAVAVGVTHSLAEIDTNLIQNLVDNFLTLLFVLGLGSATFGAATSSHMLIIGRCVVGVCAAGLMSGSLSIVANVVAVTLHALYIGIMSANFSIALIRGPLLGGASTQHVSWR